MEGKFINRWKWNARKILYKGYFMSTWKWRISILSNDMKEKVSLSPAAPWLFHLCSLWCSWWPDRKMFSWSPSSMSWSSHWRNTEDFPEGVPESQRHSSSSTVVFAASVRRECSRQILTSKKYENGNKIINLRSEIWNFLQIWCLANFGLHFGLNPHCSHCPLRWQLRSSTEWPLKRFSQEIKFQSSLERTKKNPEKGNFLGEKWENVPSAALTCQ